MILYAPTWRNGGNTICLYRTIGFFFHFFWKILNKVVDDCFFYVKNRDRWEFVGSSGIKWYGFADREI